MSRISQFGKKTVSSPLKRLFSIRDVRLFFTFLFSSPPPCLVLVTVEESQSGSIRLCTYVVQQQCDYFTFQPYYYKTFIASHGRRILDRKSHTHYYAAWYILTYVPTYVPRVLRTYVCCCCLANKTRLLKCVVVQFTRLISDIFFIVGRVKVKILRFLFLLSEHD